MRATVEGLVTSIAEESKNEKQHTELLLLQEGERVQVRARVKGHNLNYDLMERITITGRVMAWGKRSGEADYMLLVD